jgi:shikimate kinase
MVITLIGYRASGKSSVAPRLAKRLGWTWVDCDRVIEQRAGCPIARIFENEGEAGFRKRESEALADLLQQPHQVIASGGGAILSAENRQRMKDAGPVVWLHATVETLVRRLKPDRLGGSARPSLTGKPIDEEVAEVLAVREPLYRQTASLIIHSDGEPAEQVAKRIHRHLAESVRQEPPQ